MTTRRNCLFRYPLRTGEREWDPDRNGPPSSSGKCLLTLWGPLEIGFTQFREGRRWNHWRLGLVPWWNVSVPVTRVLSSLEDPCVVQVPDPTFLGRTHYGGRGRPGSSAPLDPATPGTLLQTRVTGPSPGGRRWVPTGPRKPVRPTSKSFPPRPMSVPGSGVPRV